MADELNDIRRDYRSTLKEALLEEKRRNPSCSLRSFARRIGVSKTVLGDVIAKKRHLSRDNAVQISKRLNFSPDEVRAMQAEIFEIKVGPSTPERSIVEEERFQAISDWYHYAILSLARLPRNRADAHWIAARLGITPVEARSALNRLRNLGWLTEEGGKLRRLTPDLSTKGGAPSSAIRNFHKQTLHLAEESLEKDGIRSREFTGVTMPLDLARLPQAKRMIARFRDEMSEFVSQGKPSVVYHLAVQLFPMRKAKSK